MAHAARVAGRSGARDSSVRRMHAISTECSVDGIPQASAPILTDSLTLMCERKPAIRSTSAIAYHFPLRIDRMMTKSGERGPI